MSKIVITTDFSSNSKSGIKFAFQFASKTNSEIIFYHVFEGFSDNSWEPKKGKEKNQNEISLEKLKKYIQKIISESNLPYAKYKCIVETGIDTKNMILDYAKKCKANYICISLRGAGIAKKILGSNTSFLIQHSTIPLIVIPKSYRVSEYKEIWYSSDLANLKSELNQVQKFSSNLKAPIHVYNYEYMIEVDEIKNKLVKMASKYESENIHFHFRKMKIENTLSENLQSDLKKHKPSMIVLFTKLNKSWFERLFYRNNTAEVTFDTKTPLLILRKKTK